MSTHDAQTFWVTTYTREDAVHDGDELVPPDTSERRSKGLFEPEACDHFVTRHASRLRRFEKDSHREVADVHGT